MTPQRKQSNSASITKSTDFAAGCNASRWLPFTRLDSLTPSWGSVSNCRALNYWHGIPCPINRMLIDLALESRRFVARIQNDVCRPILN